jgi:hypothetical protein
MNLTERINAFSSLGEKLSGLTDHEKGELCIGAARENSWFTAESVKLSLEGIAYFLNKGKLTQWLEPYHLNPIQSKKIGIAMAGNIPLVGFHDFLCVLISGHHAIIKLSSQDSFLISRVSDWLIEINPEFKEKINFADKLKNTDAIIATGSDNTARYFEYYFRNIPHIIRKNRSSCAVIMGEETPNQLTLLGTDIFSYFGLGCRNVSKLFIPDDFPLSQAFEAWQSYEPIIHHHRYANNYDYQKSIMLVNKTPFLDNGFIMLTESPNLVSPISVLHYETYKNQEELNNLIDVQREKIQCIVSANGWYTNSVSFGKAQLPELWDYADGINTVKFLNSLD